MNLYLLTQDENTGYDTYDSCVVVANNEEEARIISPSRFDNRTWTSSENVKVLLIGKAHKDMILGKVVCASFNAG